jgi:hypothetical protein
VWRQRGTAVYSSRFIEGCRRIAGAKSSILIERRIRLDGQTVVPVAIKYCRDVLKLSPELSLPAPKT